MSEKKDLFKDQTLIDSETSEHLLDGQLFNIALAHGQQLLQQLERTGKDIEFRFPIGGEITLNSKNIKVYEEAIKRLNVGREYNIFDEDSGKRVEWGVINPLISPKLKKEEGDPCLMCYYGLDIKVQEKLLYPNNYGKVNLKFQRRVTKRFTLPLYEKCVQVLKNNSEGHTKSMPIEKYRKWLKVEKGKYLDWKDFKKKCIKEPIIDLENSVNVTVKVEYERATNGKTPTHISFHFIKKPDTPLLKAIEESILQDSSTVSIQETVFPISDPKLKSFCTSKNIKNSFLENQKAEVMKRIPLITNDQEYEKYLIWLMNYAVSEKSIKSAAGFFLSEVKSGEKCTAKYIEEFKIIIEKKEKLEQELAGDISVAVGNAYTSEKINYIRDFLRDYPALFEVLKQMYSTQKAYEYYLSGKFSLNEMLDTKSFLALIMNLKEINEHDKFSFPLFSAWKEDTVNQSKIQQIREKIISKKMKI